MSAANEPQSDDAVAVASGCPSADALAAFASGNLTEGELVTIASHVAVCEACEQSVRTFNSDEDSVAARVRAAMLCAEPAEEPACLRMQDAARSLKPTLETASRAGTGDGYSAMERQVTATWRQELPATIGRYQVRAELGHGGFGWVYLAHDPDLNRPVAIKVPRFEAAVSDARIRWFLEEARTAAMLKHSGIIAVYEVGRQSDGSCFIVMEYVERSLAAEMSKGKLPAERAVRIVREAAAAIHFAHKQGLFHRDLKPGNILLDAEEQVKIADFGLALHEDQQRNRAGDQSGTLAYMSPEQVRGDAHRLDGRSDIWALGVILYELLVGKRPFSGTKEELADEILHRPPRPLRQIRDDIDPALEAICLKCLAKDPEQRYSSCQDVAADLKRWQQRVQPRAPRRSRAATWAALVLAGMGVAALAVVLPYLLREPEHPRLVDLAAEPFVPLDLLDRPPEQIFPKDAPDQWWEHQRRPPLIRMASFDQVFLGLGTTQSDRYRLRVEVSNTSPSGYASLFFGFHETPPENGLRRWRCQALSIHRNPDCPPYVVREELTVKESRSGTLAVVRNLLRDVRLDDLGLSAVPLEVEIRGGIVFAVRAGGRELRLVNAGADEMSLPTTGRFGLVNSRGSVTFREGRFESLPASVPR